LQNYYRPHPDRFGDGGGALPGYGTQQTMKEEPKPATGEATEKSYSANQIHQQIQQGMSDARNTPEYAEEKASEPKPATGEWTREIVLGMMATKNASMVILAAHNAALAAERETTDQAMSETVEWTPQTVNDLVRHDGYKGVADAHNRLELELAKAQAAIARHNFQMDVDRDINCTEIKTDTTALDAAIAEAVAKEGK
jgi:hypothetical protein